jgi:hypothetical protein
MPFFWRVDQIKGIMHKKILVIIKGIIIKIKRKS